MLSDKDLNTFEKKLLLMRKAIANNAENLESDVHLGGSDHVTLNHLADAGSDSFETDFSLEQLENEEGVVHQIDDALAKVANKTFGMCEECEGKIPKARLMDLPYAQNCIKCQEKLELEQQGL